MQAQQIRRANARAWGCGSGTTPPQRAPQTEGRGSLLPLPTMCVGQSRARRQTDNPLPQPHSSLNSQPCAAGQLSSSLAVISRHLTPFDRRPAAEGPLPSRRGPVGSKLLWLALSVPLSPSSPACAGGAPEAAPVSTSPMHSPKDLISLRVRPSLHRLEITALES